MAVRIQESERGQASATSRSKCPNQVFVIIEGKRGVDTPDLDPAGDLCAPAALRRKRSPTEGWVVLSECSTDYARQFLPAVTTTGVPVQNLPWRDVLRLLTSSARQAYGAERHILDEAASYMQRLVIVKPADSNMVYVVVLSPGRPPGWDISFLEIAQEYGKYMHPAGVSGWPKEPPNYIAFRWGGLPQSIHHVEDYKVFRRPHDEIPETPRKLSGATTSCTHSGQLSVPRLLRFNGKICRAVATGACSTR